MERESFENEDIGKLLNDNFVPVKVDREERPDVDRVYMTYIQVSDITLSVKGKVIIIIMFPLWHRGQPWGTLAGIGYPAVAGNGSSPSSSFLLVVRQHQVSFQFYSTSFSKSGYQIVLVSGGHCCQACIYVPDI